jgi:dienelactone hydrolase
MSEPEIATKAPESDGAEASPFLDDSPAQAGASMGEHCTTDRPTTGQRPTGELTKFKDIDVYVSKPADYPHSPSKLLLLLTGGTGIKSINNQLQADMYASQGFLVVMPDQFSGDPAYTATTDVEENPSLIEQVKLKAAETVKSFMIDMWLARHTAEKVLPIIHTVLDSAKDEYADAVANGGGIYAAGYCFGAKYVLILAGEHPDTVISGQQQKDEEAGMSSKGPSIQAGAIAHATLVTRDDLRALKAPVSMACVGQLEVGAESILANDVCRTRPTLSGRGSGGRPEIS